MDKINICNVLVHWKWNFYLLKDKRLNGFKVIFLISLIKKHNCICLYNEHINISKRTDFEV